MAALWGDLQCLCSIFDLHWSIHLPLAHHRAASLAGAHQTYDKHPCLPHLGSLDHCTYGQYVCSGGLHIWNPILPFDVEKHPEAAHVGEVQLVCVTTVDCQSLTSIWQEKRKDDYVVYHEFGFQSDTSSFPHIGMSSAKNHTCTCNSVVDLFIGGDCP